MNTLTKLKGFTLIELMIVVTIIGMMTALILPNFLRVQQESRIASVANNLRIFRDAFLVYSMDNGVFPPDNHNDIPPEMVTYINETVWESDALGGHYNWEGPNTYSYAGISLFDTTASTNVLSKLDDRIDDGNLATGNFRLTSNNRYTYIISE